MSAINHCVASSSFSSPHITVCSFVNVPKNLYTGKSVAGVETCNKTLNFIENPVCGIEERASGERKEMGEKKEEERRNKGKSQLQF